MPETAKTISPDARALLMLLVPRNGNSHCYCVVRHPTSSKLVVKRTDANIDLKGEYLTAHQEHVNELVNLECLEPHVDPERYVLSSEGMQVGKELWKPGKSSLSVR